MKQKLITAGTITLILVSIPFSRSAGQEVTVKSNRVEFVIEESGTDQAPPSIRLITPAIGTSTYYSTTENELHLIGQVDDESPITLVSVDADVRELNASGFFTANLTFDPGLNKIRIVAMDQQNNMAELMLVVEYSPDIETLESRIRANSTFHALLIGINEYQDDRIQDLVRPIPDAQQLYNVLTTEYMFEKDHITFLKNPTRKEIIQIFEVLRKEVAPEDNLLIFYAGHGYWDEEGDIGYWLPSDASNQTKADWFRNSALVEELSVINSKHTLLITDACFAGSIFEVSRSVELATDIAYEKIYDLKSRKAMTSGSKEEVPDDSAFLKYLIDRLYENEEKYLTAEDLFYRIRKAVMSNSDVYPLYGAIRNVGNEGGDFIFLKR